MSIKFKAIKIFTHHFPGGVPGTVYDTHSSVNRALNRTVVLRLLGNLNLSFIYTLCLTIRSPVVVGGAVQVITSSSHDPGGGDIMRSVGASGTVYDTHSSVN